VNRSDQLREELLRRAVAWKARLAEARCECGRRTHRSMEEIALFEVITTIEAETRFDTEAPTIPQIQNRPTRKGPNRHGE